MAKFEGFEEILAWQKAYDVTLQIYRCSASGEFAKDFGLKDQIRRAAVSVMANIAEGHGRRSNSEFANFLNVARGSVAEVQSHLHIALGLDYLERGKFDTLYNDLAEVSKMTLSLARYLRNSVTSQLRNSTTPQLGMYFLYSIILTVAFIVLIPRFIFDWIFKGKYAAGFKQRLGFVPEVDARGKKVIWIHCVSVGEVNAARPLAALLRKEFPFSRIVVSTTTLTGQKMAQTAFAGIADLIFYFPFDWRSTVRRSLSRIKPTVVLLMETEIWFNFIRETNKSRARIAIVNGRMSERSFDRYAKIKRFMKRVLGYLDLAAMQEDADATRIMSLGLRASKAKVTGNMKFDHELDEQETALTGEIRTRFGITPEAPLIIAASTHTGEEKWVLDAFKEVWKSSSGNLPRLLIAPRHPERFAEVAELVKKTGFTWVRRSEQLSSRDMTAEIILLDTIGELRAAYPLAELVFVGGSLIPRGGQSVLEPAAAGKAVITGPHTANFEGAIAEFTEKDAIRQLPAMKNEQIVPALVRTFNELLADSERRRQLGSNAMAAMKNNSGAVHRTLEHILPLLKRRENS